MLKRNGCPASAGGRGLMLVALVAFLSGLLGVFVGFTVPRFTVHGLGLGRAYAEQAQRVEDRETGKQGDRERGRQGAEVRAESRDGRSPGVVVEDEEMRAVDERLIIGKEKTAGHILLDPGTGNVGIGTTGPGAKLSVAGGGAFGSTYAGTSVADGNVIISGNVGIGTTTPTAKLDIDGTIRIRGGGPVANEVLTTIDATGVASWQDPASIVDSSLWELHPNFDVLRPKGDFGVAMRGNFLAGRLTNSHVNLGVGCSTGASGVDRKYCTVSGGHLNVAVHDFATVGGGQSNAARGVNSTVAGGWLNVAKDMNSTVGGGQSNEATGMDATVAGGEGNKATGIEAAVGGGQSNTASGQQSTVAGGQSNSADAQWATVGGGQTNRATRENATVAGGKWNEASGVYAVVSGGWNNKAIDSFAVISGGRGNWATADYATIPGGAEIRVNAKGSFGFGFGGEGDMVFVNDSFDIVFGDGGFRNYEFGINQESPAHPLHIGTDATNGNGAHLTADGQWMVGSSREFKENFQELNGADILNKVKEMSVTRWQYKGSDSYHIGPVSEDFHNAFGVSEEKYLSSMDVSGVALIAIQELIQRLETQNQRLEAQNQRLETQQEEIEALKKKIAESNIH